MVCMTIWATRNLRISSAMARNAPIAAAAQISDSPAVNGISAWASAICTTSSASWPKIIHFVYSMSAAVLCAFFDSFMASSCALSRMLWLPFVISTNCRAYATNSVAVWPSKSSSTRLTTCRRSSSTSWNFSAIKR